jgi:hypothetical protein
MSWSLIQSRNSAGGVSPQSLAFTSNVVAGRLLIVDIYIEDGAATVTGITDTLGTSYVAATGYGAGTLGRSITYIGIAPSSGANTVQVTTSAGTLNLIISEVNENTSGPSTTVNVLGVANTGSSATPSSNNATTTIANCLLWGTIIDNSQLFSSGLTAGWAINQEQANNQDFVSLYSLANAAAAGTYSFTSTFTGSGAWATQIFAIQANAGASAVLTGTAIATINESDIVAGGKTIIITLTGATWILP